ncbi:heparinase II/III domain-containing protein [Nonomuraea sp. SBT364]|uniref:heparinase II/III domain-containing protein n=1 Tax=Nonomuraea sp. SBT364 TaxID=1580530 RepID=UPI0007C8040C|nr:heparinase II/III family protein [Nonomuraea sp. SBT364]
MMTDTATGPLLTAWGAPGAPGALGEKLAHLLLPPDAALPPVSPADPGAAVRDLARAERGTPWPQPLASQYARYFKDGDRTSYETSVFTRQDRLTRAVLMAVATGDGAWVDEAADGIVLLCEQSSWCWPAHDDHHRRLGVVLPDLSGPYLDLGAADVAGQLAWADHALGRLFDERFPGLRERVRDEVRTRVLEPFTRRRDWHWLGLDGDVHNWCPWICGNVLVAALRLAEPGAERAGQVAWAVAGVDRYLAALPADGSVDEGYEYWWNGACRALEALDVLEHATSGALTAVDVPVVRQTVRFPHRMHLGGPWYVNFADARALPPAGQPWQVVHRWARRLGEQDAGRHAAAHRDAAVSPEAELGRALAELADETWRTAGPAEPPLADGVWLPGTQVGVARTRDGLTLAVKGGHNAEHHNHNDVGSVIIAVDGVPVVADAGRPTYTAQTFGPDRYAIWTMRSDWHSVPEVRGTPQGQGERFRARDTEVTDEAGIFRVRLDLAEAYPVEGLARWWRTARLDRDAGTVTIEDAWSFAAAGAGSVLHYLLAGQVTLSAGRAEVRPVGGGRTVFLSWDPGRAAVSTTVRELDDPMLSSVWGERMTRLELRLPGTAGGSFRIQAGVCA